MDRGSTITAKKKQLRPGQSDYGKLHVLPQLLPSMFMTALYIVLEVRVPTRYQVGYKQARMGVFRQGARNGGRERARGGWREGRSLREGFALTRPARA